MRLIDRAFASDVPCRGAPDRPITVRLMDRDGLRRGASYPQAVVFKCDLRSGDDRKWVWVGVRLKDRVFVISREADGCGKDAGCDSATRKAGRLIAGVGDAQVRAMDNVEALIPLLVFGEGDFVVGEVVVGGDFADVAREV